MRSVRLEEIGAAYDGFLIDQFGVLLNGEGAYPYAPAALARLASYSKPIVLLSNSGKRAGPNEARLTRLGFARGSYLSVLSSGEAAHRALSRRYSGGRIWLHARDLDRSASEGLGFDLVDAPEVADLLLLAGSNADHLSMADYEAMLQGAAMRRVPMICTNPDLEMLTPQGIRFGAGAIAARYADMGGPVEYIGKPHPLIYAEAARLLEGIDPARVLCIGDSPAHDIRGGQAAGHATALVHRGLHTDLSVKALAALCEAEGAVPDLLLVRFEFGEAL